MTATLEALRARGVLSALDDRFARGLARLASEERPDVLLAVALASRQAVLGDACVHLPSVSGTVGDEAEDGDPIVWPPLSAWLERLATSRLVAADAAGSEATPLVLDGSGRLYLRRLWQDEERLARELAERAAPSPETGSPAALRASIERLLPMSDSEAREIHWPRVAAAVAVGRRLCVISGRPGTGKTTTAARLLAVLVERARAADLPAPRIALAAPTGKAAARLAEAIARARGEMDCEPDVLAAIPTRASTLHRLLRLDPRPRRSRSAAVGLRADVVLVDEASMVDLRVAARLVRALPRDAKLVLLGDPDQLASVEAGSVFADLCGPRRAPEYGAEMASWIADASGQSVWAAQSRAEPIRDCVVRLTKSHRYAAQSGIGELARAIQSGDASRALEVLEGDAYPDARLLAPGAEGEAAELQRTIGSGYADFGRASSPREALAALDRFRVLCAVREGPFGVEALNREVDAALVESGALPRAPRGGAGVAAGRPILVTRNAPQLGLYNGDVGITDASGAAHAFFDTGGGEAALRRFGIARLPAHEPVFAMTVHKSQGSEYDEVVLVLPEEPIPLLTRELVYTAVTRARRKVVVHASEDVLSAAIARRTARASGLRDALWGPSG